MTAPRELLDQLDALHAAGTPGEWLQHPSDGEYVIADVSEDGDSYSDVADTYAFRKKTGYADAALIVAAVNALPQLTAALRELADLADSYPLGSDVPVYRLHRILDTLSPAEPQSGGPA